MLSFAYWRAIAVSIGPDGWQQDRQVPNNWRQHIRVLAQSHMLLDSDVQTLSECFLLQVTFTAYWLSVTVALGPANLLHWLLSFAWLLRLDSHTVCIVITALLLRFQNHYINHKGIACYVLNSLDCNGC